ncbi:MAG: hypothetical protein K8H86_09905 [Ignavibacteriaceae bacterium]|nr:hypothetical protein [Ignavibacteriaceae bacterium]
MKKIILLIIPFLFWGCEKKTDNILDPQTSNYQVTWVSYFNSFQYAIGDSSAVFFLQINPSSDVQKAYFNIYSPDNDMINTSPVVLYDDGNTIHGDRTSGDNVFSNKFPFSQSYLNGNYQARYFITSNDGITNQVAIHNFIYENGQNNIAPVISNLTAPDTVEVLAPNSLILLSIEAADANGLNDIKSVSFISYRPDGTTNGNKVELNDDGNSANGDAAADDGIYSVVIQVTPSNTKGTYKFVFQATDRGNKLSNTIEHHITLK